MASDTQTRRLGEMILWLEEHRDWAELICGVAECPPEDLPALIEALAEREYYEFLLVLLMKNRTVRPVGRVLHRCMEDHLTALLSHRGPGPEALALAASLRAELGETE